MSSGNEYPTNPRKHKGGKYYDYSHFLRDIDQEIKVDEQGIRSLCGL